MLWYSLAFKKTIFVPLRKADWVYFKTCSSKASQILNAEVSDSHYANPQLGSEQAFHTATRWTYTMSPSAKKDVSEQRWEFGWLSGMKASSVQWVASATADSPSHNRVFLQSYCQEGFLRNKHKTSRNTNPFYVGLCKYLRKPALPPLIQRVVCHSGTMLHPVSQTDAAHVTTELWSRIRCILHYHS